jgi:hypothetical protein
MKPKLNSFSSACCCLICVLSCACAGCVIYRYEHQAVVLEAHRILIDCAKEKQRLDREERKRYLLEELKSMDVRVTMSGKYYFAWKIGKGANAVCVCRDAFHVAHHISSWYTDELIALYKNGSSNGSRMLNDRSSYEQRQKNCKVLQALQHCFDSSASAGYEGA